jgi:glycosyltransferase involved in cell wall biosynthesis
MRILHILNDVTDRGNGIVHAAIDLAAGQVVCGHTVAIASCGGGLEPLLERIGIQHLYIDLERNPLTLIKAIARLQRLVNTFKPDVVHAHVRTGLALGWLVSKLAGYPLVAHLHNIHEKESLMMALADRVIAVSSNVADTIAAQGISSRKIRTVLNGPLGSPRYPPIREIEPANIKRPAIVTVCGMNHRKGISDLLTSFDQVAAEIEGVDLYLVGDGPDISTFRQAAKQSPHRSRIHFEGCQTIPQRYMAACDIFVLASRRESFGLVLLEAREVGCAIVAADVDGIPEALDGGQAGILFKSKDASALSDILIRLIKSPEERREWQARAVLGIEKFTYVNMARSMDVVYEELLNNCKRSNVVQISRKTVSD